MFQRIKLGVISSIRSKVTMIAIVCLLVCQLMTMFDLNAKAEQERREFLLDYDKSYTNYWGDFWGGFYESYFLEIVKIGQERYDYYDSIFDYLNSMSKLASDSIRNNDYLRFYENNIKVNILLTETVEEQQKKEPIETDDDFFQGIELIKKIKKEWKLPNYSLDYVLGPAFDLWWAPQFISQVTYSYEMYERGIDQLYTPSFFNGNTALYQYISNLFPIMILVLTIFLFYNQYEKDKRTGTIKNRMIQPQKRIFYLIEKMITNFIVILIVLAIPTLISNILACVFYGMDFVNIPILAYPDGVTSFASVPNSLEILGDDALFMGFTTYTGFPTLEYKAPHLMLEIMDFHVFMILVIGLLLLFILFNVILNQFITTIFRNPNVSLAVNLIVAGLCFSMVSIGNTSVLGMWNPYSYANPIVNLAGTSYYTYAMGIVVLSIYCVVLFILSAVILRKKDVA